MVKSIYHCDTCKKRLFDLLTDEYMIEIKCNNCKEVIKINMEQLNEFLMLNHKTKDMI